MHNLKNLKSHRQNHTASQDYKGCRPPPWMLKTGKKLSLSTFKSYNNLLGLKYYSANGYLGMHNSALFLHIMMLT
jgi:hypothetical protein